jgi:hypothetical protein
VGVVTDPSSNTVVLGDMNQEGSLSGNCGVSQNGRGGLFFALSDPTLHADLVGLLQGDSAPQQAAHRRVAAATPSQR